MFKAFLCLKMCEMKKYLPSLLLLALVLITTVVFAQIGGGTGVPPPPIGNPPPGAVPIDGGVLALLAGGIAYGAKKLYNKG